MSGFKAFLAFAISTLVITISIAAALFAMRLYTTWWDKYSEGWSELSGWAKATAATELAGSGLILILASPLLFYVVNIFIVANAASIPVYNKVVPLKEKIKLKLKRGKSS
tara:strand:+ start:4050 stop:4379 length:330 start_codon:yes stop_codon:yes gene_type:complete